VVADAQVAFFSYCREDSDFALRLAEDLKTAGALVWIDQLWRRGDMIPIPVCFPPEMLAGPGEKNDVRMPIPIDLAAWR
jgi:hypothetical protein